MRPVFLAVGGGVLVLALGAAALVHYTQHKLDLGGMVRGELPGATFVDADILAIRPHRGAESQLGEGRFADQCELEMRATIAGAVRSVRDWADADCPSYRVGGTARIAFVPGETEPYLQHGTWASQGNAAFDRGLLVGERGIAIALGVVGLGLGLAGLRRRR